MTGDAVCAGDESSGPEPTVNAPACRFCASPLAHTFVDLGMSPLCESFLSKGQLDGVEHFYPLHVWVCHECFLVQLREYVKPDEIFTEYAYFSSYSDAWLAHAKRYVDAMVDRFRLGPEHLAVELASNDGYLLQYFADHRVPVLGVEPAANVAAAAEERGVRTVVDFFGRDVAQDLLASEGPADLLTANNVLAQVPDINDFVSGIRTLLSPSGVVTIEFPHLLRLVEGNQFDTIYHEHFSYFSFLTTVRILAAHGLEVFDVEELWTHGGSLRVYAQREDAGVHAVAESVPTLLGVEREAGYDRIEGYAGFEERVRRTKRDILAFLIDAKRGGKTIAGYGAPGKGNTLLNYCGIRSDFIDYTVDRNPYKRGKYLPGTRIPIHPPDRIFETRPDYVFILPWNLRDEIVTQMQGIREWGGQFVTPIPELEIIDPATEG